MSLKVGPGVKIRFHFVLSLETGEIVDSTREKSAPELILGDGNLPKGFEEVLLGMAEGERQVHRIPPEKAFGMPNPNNIQRFPTENFSGQTLEVGLVINFADAANAEVPGVIAEIGTEDVQVDFNHPLAGQTLLFDTEILEILPATQH